MIDFIIFWSTFICVASILSPLAIDVYETLQIRRVRHRQELLEATLDFERFQANVQKERIAIHDELLHAAILSEKRAITYNSMRETLPAGEAAVEATLIR